MRDYRRLRWKGNIPEGRCFASSWRRACTGSTALHCTAAMYLVVSDEHFPARDEVEPSLRSSNNTLHLWTERHSDCSTEDKQQHLVKPWIPDISASMCSHRHAIQTLRSSHVCTGEPLPHPGCASTSTRRSRSSTTTSFKPIQANPLPLSPSYCSISSSVSSVRAKKRLSDCLVLHDDQSKYTDNPAPSKSSRAQESRDLHVLLT